MSIPSELYPGAPPAQRNPQLVQAPDLIGTSAISLAPGSAFTLIDGKQCPLDADTYMTYFGNSIDVTANQNFVTFQIRVNGTPYKAPFDRITSQIGQANLPTRFPVPFLLGRGVKVEVFGAVAAGAAGNTLLITQVGLLHTAPGVPPLV
jgi:hypothetical protein